MMLARNAHDAFLGRGRYAELLGAAIEHHAGGGTRYPRHAGDVVYRKARIFAH